MGFSVWGLNWVFLEEVESEIEMDDSALQER